VSAAINWSISSISSRAATTPTIRLAAFRMGADTWRWLPWSCAMKLGSSACVRPAAAERKKGLDARLWPTSAGSVEAAIVPEPSITYNRSMLRVVWKFRSTASSTARDAGSAGTSSARIAEGERAMIVASATASAR